MLRNRANVKTSQFKRLVIVARSFSLVRMGVLLAGLASMLVVGVWWFGATALLAVGAYVAGVFTTQFLRSSPRAILRFLTPPTEKQIRGERYKVGGRELEAQVVDLPPGGYKIGNIDIRVQDSSLEVPQQVLESAETMERILEAHPARSNVVFQNGPCLVVATPPRLTRAIVSGREEPRVSFEVARTSYFVKALSRGCPPATILQHVTPFWPPHVIHPEDVRKWLLDADGENHSSLTLPNFGVTLALTLRSGVGKVQRTGVYQVRGSANATHPGVFSAPISEAFNLSDQDENSPFLDVEKAAKRAAGEELGLPSHEVTVRIAGIAVDLVGTNKIDRNGILSGGGYNFVGHVEVDMSPDELSELWARDRYETGEMHLYPLTAEGLAQALAKQPPDGWFSLGVIAMLSALEAEDVHGPRKVGAILRDLKWGRDDSASESAS